MAQMYKLDPLLPDLDVKPETTMYRLQPYHEQLSSAPSSASTSQPDTTAVHAKAPAAKNSAAKAEKKEKSKGKDKAAPAAKPAHPPATSAVNGAADAFRNLTLEEKAAKLDEDISVLVEQMREFKKDMGLQMKKLKAAKAEVKPEKSSANEPQKNDGQQKEKAQKAEGKAKDNQKNGDKGADAKKADAKPKKAKADGKEEKKQKNAKNEAKLEKKEATPKPATTATTHTVAEANEALPSKFALELTIPKIDVPLFDALTEALKSRGVNIGPNPTGDKVVKVKIADSDDEPTLTGDLVKTPAKGRVDVWSRLNSLIFSPQGNIPQLLRWFHTANDVLHGNIPVDSAARALNQHIQVQDFLASAETPTLADFIWLHLIGKLAYAASTTELWIRAVQLGGHKRGE